MKCILDTHFLLWITLRVPRLDEFPWLERYAPWGLSPVSFLEVKYLAEVGRFEVRMEPFVQAVMADPRFVVDEIPLLQLMHHALPLSWTRDPFDRLLAAHSGLRRAPLASVDETIVAHHPLLVRELRG